MSCGLWCQDVGGWPVESGWGALHWEVDDFDLGPCDNTVIAGFYSALGDSCGSEDLSVIDGFWIGDSSPRCVHILPNLTGRAVQ